MKSIRVAKENSEFLLLNHKPFQLHSNKLNCDSEWNWNMEWQYGILINFFSMEYWIRHKGIRPAEYKSADWANYYESFA